MHVEACVFVCVCVPVCVCMCVSLYMCVCTCMLVHVDACVCVCVSEFILQTLWVFVQAFMFFVCITQQLQCNSAPLT